MKVTAIPLLFLPMSFAANAESDTYQITVVKTDGSTTRSFSLYTEDNEQVNIELALDKSFEINKDDRLLGVFSENDLNADIESQQIYYLVGKENTGQVSIFGLAVTMDNKNKETPLLERVLIFILMSPMNIISAALITNLKFV